MDFYLFRGPPPNNDSPPQFALETAQTKVKEGEDLVGRQQTQISHLNKMVEDAAVKYNECHEQVVNQLVNY